MEQQLKGGAPGIEPNPKAGKQSRPTERCLVAAMAQSALPVDSLEEHLTWVD